MGDSTETGANIQTTSANQVSKTFHPLEFFGQLTYPDVIFVSSDGVRFHAHSTVLWAASANGFGSLLVGSADNMAVAAIQLQYTEIVDDAATFNVVLLAAYGLNVQAHSPDLTTLLRATEAGLIRYGLFSSYILTPGMPLAAVLLAHAQRGPDIALDIYTVAARHGAAFLAVSVSSYMHGLDLSTISAERAHELGGAYLRRLFMLVLDRTEALKRMLIITPGPLHDPTVFCGPKERSRDVLGPWGLTVSQLMMNARADISAARLEATLNPLLLQCACAECRVAIQNRIRAIVSEWLRVRNRFHSLFMPHLFNKNPVFVFGAARESGAVE